MRHGKLSYLLLFLLGGFLYILLAVLKGLGDSETTLVDHQGFPRDINQDDLHREMAQEQLKRVVKVKKKVFHVDVNKHNLPQGVYSLEVDKRRTVPFCPEKSVLQSPISAQREVFQSVVRGNTGLYVFSAYYDNRANSIVRVIGASDRSGPKQLYCQLWYRKDERVMAAVPVSVYTVPEGSGRRYESVYLTCTNPAKEVPYAVSITATQCQSPVNTIEVVPVITKTPEKRSFVMCVTPFNLAYDKVDQLVEYLEVNRILGASHAIFYNYSTSARVKNLLQTYIDDGFVTVVQWPLPMKVHVWPIPPGYVEEIKYFGQMASLNECLFRTMGRYKYAVFADLDELLIPRKHRNWHELFSEHLESHDISSTSGWTFRNTFFKTEWPSDKEMEANKTIAGLKAMTLLKVRREQTIAPPGSRSKLIVNPLLVTAMGCHNLWDYHGSVSTLPEDVGLCHHYRFWEGMGEKTFVVDKNVFRLREAIVQGVGNARRRLQLM